MQQKTVRARVKLEGIGLHTGTISSIEILPAPPNQGIRFLKRQREGSTVAIHANALLVSATERGTSLSEQGETIHTVEHLLSALYSQEIDNADIVIDGEELPILDGSAKPFVDAVRHAGLSHLEAERRYFRITEPIWFSLPPHKYIVALPNESFRVTFAANYPGTLADSQTYTFSLTPDGYQTEIAPARTFAFADEVKMLREMGLAKGGNLENAIVVYPDRYSSPLRFPNELVRHKILDLIGDLALTGVALVGHFIAIRSGHELNTQFAQLLLKKIEQSEKNGVTSS